MCTKKQYIYIYVYIYMIHCRDVGPMNNSAYIAVYRVALA